jgi:hypothetical protein
MSRSTIPALLLLLSSLGVAACGASGDKAGANTAAADTAAAAVAPDPAQACLGLRPVPVAIAVADFIGTADPKPLRFLNAASTDSALPPAAEAVVQDKGPTFYWLSSEKNQQQIRDKLAGDGDWATLLVVIRENVDHGDGTHTIRVGGRYVGAPHDGKESPEKRYEIACQIDSVAHWAVTNGTMSDSASAGAP